MLTQNFTTTSTSAIQLPTLWVADALKARHFSKLFNLREFTQVGENIPQGENFILFDPSISESEIKSTAWQIRAAGESCQLHRIKSPLDYLVIDQLTARELTTQIFEFSQPYEAWRIRQDAESLTIREASELASVAIRVLKQPERGIELGIIRERSNQNSYDWNKLVTNLEEEFKKELKARRSNGESNITDLERESPARSKTKQFYNLLFAEWGQYLKFNTMTLKPELKSQPLELDTLAVQLAIDFDIDISNEKAGQIVVRIAKENSYSPVQEYLNRVAQEHNSEDLSLLDGLATRYFGSNEPLHNTFMRKHLIGLVKRAFEPGCQLDSAVILQGSQGKQKSTFWRTLAVNPDWFDDTITSGNNDKDERLKLRRYWILELAELESVFRRKEIASLRGFLTTKSDNLRVPYGRTIESFPRSSGFVGSVNPSQFLADPEGHRRFWVVPVAFELIPIDQLIEERDRIWAAAVHAYRNQEQSYLTRAEEKRNALLNQRHEIEDSWEEAIDAFLEFQTETSVSQVLSECLKIEIGRHERILQMRVAECLKRIGWVKSEKKKTNGKVFQVWRCPADEVTTDIRAEVTTALNSVPTSDTTNATNNLLSEETTKVATSSNPIPASVLIKRLLPLDVFSKIFEIYSSEIKSCLIKLENQERGSNPIPEPPKPDIQQGLTPVSTQVATSVETVATPTYKVGDKVEFFCESSHQWVKGKIIDVRIESGYFVKAVVEFWSRNKKRQATLCRQDWLKAV
jgi:predicted P-loop ATPase